MEQKKKFSKCVNPGTKKEEIQDWIDHRTYDRSVMQYFSVSIPDIS